MRRAALPLFLWLAAVVVGLMLYSSPALRKYDRDSDLLSMLFGESRAVISNQMILTADAYYHGGMGDVKCEHSPLKHVAETDAGTTGEVTGEHDEEEHDHAAEHMHEHEHTPAGMPDDWWSRINQAVHPSGHRHLSGVRYEKELLPWIWFAVRADPHNVDAYNLGAYWLANRLGRVEAALKLIEQGIELNPNDFELELSRGTILLRRLNDAVAAEQALCRARDKWQRAAGQWRQAAEPVLQEAPDPLAYGFIMLCLGRISEQQADYQQALQRYQEALPYVSNRAAVAAHCADLRRRLVE